jgi:hypothetical protein
MRYVAMLVACVVAALVAVGTGVAAQAEHITIHIEDQFQDPDLTAACGTPISISVVGDLKVTLVRNQEGLVVLELDRLGGTKVTYSSAQGSFSFMLTTSSWDYGEGAVVGSDVIVSFHGLMGHAPGFIDSDAGLFRFLGVVTGFDEFGIPQVDFVEVISDRGNRNSGEDITAAICGALT